MFPCPCSKNRTRGSCPSGGSPRNTSHCYSTRNKLPKTENSDPRSDISCSCSTARKSRPPASLGDSCRPQAANWAQKQYSDYFGRRNKAILGRAERDKENG